MPGGGGVFHSSFTLPPPPILIITEYGAILKTLSRAFKRGTEIEKNRDYHLCPLPQLMPKKERTI
jgi:hypothetical protein